MNYDAGHNRYTINAGDRVRFIDARGVVRTGTANALLLFPTHLVLDMGGAHGTPCVVMPRQIIGVRTPTNR